MTSQALRDLKEIGGYAQKLDLTDADEFAQRLLEQAESLTTFPFRHGTFVGQQNIRKVPFRSYIIFYKIYEKDQVVEILRFWHAARDQRRLRLREEDSNAYSASPSLTAKIAL